MAPDAGFPAYGFVHKTTTGNGKFYIETGANVGVPAGVAALYVAIDWSASTTANYSGTCQAAVEPRFRWTLSVTPPSDIRDETIYVPITFDWGQYMDATVDTSHYLLDNFWSEASTSDLYGRAYSLYNIDPNILSPLDAFSDNFPRPPHGGLPISARVIKP
jgi:hypothetical protein